MGKPPAITKPSAAATARKERLMQRRLAQLDVLSQIDCLRTLPDEEREHLVDVCVLRAFRTGEDVISYSQPANLFFCLLQGAAELRICSMGKHEVLSGVLQTGDCFGEGPLFGDFFRRIRVTTTERCDMLQANITELRSLLPVMPTFQEILRQKFVYRMAHSVLARVPLFKHLEPAQQRQINDMLIIERHAADTTLLEQNQPGNGLHIIGAGKVEIERDGQTIATLSEGDFLGELVLQQERSYPATARALTRVETLMLPVEAWHHWLNGHPETQSHFQHMLQERQARYDWLEHDQKYQRYRALIMSHGLLRGSHLLVQDLDHCVDDCNECEQACADRHGQRRLALHGARIGHYDVVSTCRQCRVDAECVAACPEDAFVWYHNGALQITDACTGCQECLPACPYTAITSVPRTTPEPTDLHQRLQSTLERWWQPFGAILPFRWHQLTSRIRADKCDLCADYDDLACVAQCPHQAMKLVPIEEIFPL
ncbi:MAG: cyclic nucleotide-binding domain-containing protein [Chloroflexaceae bacterium]|nr:cyclic nucleotide-binding domain-containing protein [Chloroflexaceae bacterium]